MQIRVRQGGAGLALAVLSAATFGTSGTLAASLIGSGWSPGAAVVARVGVAALILTVPAMLQLRGRWLLLRREAGRVVTFGLVAVAGCQLFFFNAVQRVPVGVALLLEYLGVIAVVGWLWVRRGLRPRRLTLAGGAAAMAGLAMVLDLAGSAGIDPVGVMWGLLAAIGLAAYFLLSASGGRPDRQTLPPVAMTWAGMCVGAALLAGFGWSGVLPLTVAARDVDLLGYRVSWVVPVLGLSLLAAVVAYVAGIGAARRLGAKLASFVGMSEVLFAIGFAWLLLGQLPSALQFAGGALILAGVVLVRADELSATAAVRPARAPARAGGPGMSGAGRQGQPVPCGRER